MEHNEAVFALLKTALWGAERFPMSADSETNWQRVYQELSDHAVSSLTVDTLPLIPGLEPDLRQKWIMGSTRKMMFWHKLMGVQQKLCDLLKNEGIPHAILKGASAAAYYPKPEYRTMGDIDLLVSPADCDRAVGLFQERGWEIVKDIGRHVELKKDGVDLELHRYFAILADSAASEALDDLLFDALERMEETTLNQYRIVKLPKLETGLVLLAHIGQHLRSGLGLRQIVDWMLYVDRELDDDFWNKEFRQWTQITGMEALAVHVTRMCQLYLGLQKEPINWCADADEDLCRELMELILGRGNFGRKVGDYVVVSNVVTRFGNWKNLLETLQKRGEYNWRALRKHPWLRPFAWFYQICRYIRRGLARKNPFRQLGSNVRQVRRENQLWERLGVNPPREEAPISIEHD